MGATVLLQHLIDAVRVPDAVTLILLHDAMLVVDALVEVGDGDGVGVGVGVGEGVLDFGTLDNAFDDEGSSVFDFPTLDEALLGVGVADGVLGFAAFEEGVDDGVLDFTTLEEALLGVAEGVLDVALDDAWLLGKALLGDGVAELDFAAQKNVDGVGVGELSLEVDKLLNRAFELVDNEALLLEEALLDGWKAEDHVLLVDNRLELEIIVGDDDGVAALHGEQDLGYTGCLARNSTLARNSNLACGFW